MPRINEWTKVVYNNCPTIFDSWHRQGNMWQKVTNQIKTATRRAPYRYHEVFFRKIVKCYLFNGIKVHLRILYGTSKNFIWYQWRSTCQIWSSLTNQDTKYCNSYFYTTKERDNCPSFHSSHWKVKLIAWVRTWFQRILSELGFSEKEPTHFHGDNTSAIKITENPICHERTKHIK